MKIKLHTDISGWSLLPWNYLRELRAEWTLKFKRASNSYPEYAS